LFVKIITIEVVSIAEERCPEINSRLTGMAIREYLLQVGVGCPYEFYKCFKKVKPNTSYGSVVRYFWMLKKLGLIEVVGTEDRGYGIPRKLYRLVPGREDDPAWFRPQIVMYPQTKWGRKRYKWAKEKGLA